MGISLGLTVADAAFLVGVQDWVKQLTKRGIVLMLANPSRVVVKQIARSDIPKLVGPENIVVRTADAIEIARVPPLIC